MTALEKEIIELLKDDARLTPKKIAAMLNKTESEIQERIHALENSGAIVKYTTIVNEELADSASVEALIEVRVTPKKGEGFDGIARQISELPEVKGVYLMSGAYDLAVFLEGTSLQKVAQFVSERISTYDGVISTATHFILKKYKIEGTQTEKTPTDRRMLVQA
ncbi:MAG: Lrp/AsnC family transcriptional regulator [Clostridia bacterium]|nr:Lrp/AsnC family transcriptional regulator [Clostridia bacterium]